MRDLKKRCSTPRLIIASPDSGAGKTTLATGLMGALTSKGYKVQPYKVGPDYIDPTYHALVTGTSSRNLDIWLTSESSVRETFARTSDEADIAVIEGVMGLFDGRNSRSDRGSTAHVSRLLEAPVVLVVNASGMARSAAAVVLGFKQMDPSLDICGIILNQIGGPTHAEMLNRAIRQVTKIEVVGAIPRAPKIQLEERHLGLVPTMENKMPKDKLETLTDLTRAHVDLEAIIRIARKAKPFSVPSRPRKPDSVEKKVNIGIAYDEAFNFYYKDNLELLESAGARLVGFSPLHQKSLPKDLDGLYFAGGFPEIYAKQLATNESMRNSITEKAQDETPVYAECGGLMYLTKSITDFTSTRHPMIGVLEADIVMERHLQALGYTRALIRAENPFIRAQSVLRGHEFHYSRMIGVPADAKLIYEMKLGKGILDGRDGWLVHNTLASYMHMHYGQNPKLARRFVEACTKSKKK